MDIDETLLRQAEGQARQQGKSLSEVMETALRIALANLTTAVPVAVPTTVTDGLDDDDPFFAALKEIRARGRIPAAHREIEFR